MIYSIEVKNLGSAIDASTLDIVDPLPAGLTFFRGAIDQSTTEPVKFVDGAIASGLACCTSAHISYSTDGGTTYSYLPPADYDAAITHVRVRPAGTMAGGDSSFQGLFRARIK